MRRSRSSLASLSRVALLAAATAALAPACSLGQGTGCFVDSTLDVPACWSGSFDLQPNFFAAITTGSAALQLRIQNGIDSETFSDGMLIQVDDLGEVRGDPLADGTPRPSLLGEALAVGLAPSVTAPGVPVKAVANPPVVHATLYLNRTCRTQNVALYALDAVSLEADGTCNRPAGGEPPPACGAPETIASEPAADAGPPMSAAVAASTELCASCPCVVAPVTAPDAAATPNVGRSAIRFRSLFDGDPAESNAEQRLTSADFDLYLGDPREVCPGGLGPPPRCRGHLQGHFEFYYQRGRPAQAFP